MKFSLSSICRKICLKDLLRFLIVVVVLAGTVTATVIVSGGSDGSFKDKISGIFGSDECDHEWIEATCKSAKTCSKCGEKEGFTLAHKLVDATCTTPQHCSVCQTTWGEAPGHNWRDANCVTAKTCKSCGEVEGDALGHDWAEATCDVAKTCNKCKIIEGTALGHDLVVETQIADCTHDGYTASACTRCDYSEITDETPKLGHLNDVKLEFVAPTCTETGLTEGMHCSRCNKDTVPQTIIRATGHKHDELISSLAATCTAEGEEKYECTVCGDVKTVVLPKLDHDFGSATCTDAAACLNCGFDNGGEPIGHTWTEATCTAPKTCSRCSSVEGEALGHDMQAASCLAPSTCSRCSITEGEKLTHHLTVSYVNKVAKYTCTICERTFSLGKSLHLDGSGYEGMYGVTNNFDNGYDAVETEGNDYPIIVDDGENKYYTLLKRETTDTKKQLQIWLPTEDKTKTDFTSYNGGVGFLSFKINAFMDSNLDMKIIDGGSGATRWTAEWGIVDAFFTIFPPETKDGKTTVKVTGWNDRVIKEFDITGKDSKFTGWFEVAIGIVLDESTDTIIMHYYIDGEFVATESKPLTTSSNAVNCIYLTGNSCEGGSGVMLDDVIFGHTIAGEWLFDGAHVHSWKVSGTPTEPTCTTDGVTIYECDDENCTAVTRTTVPALGHVHKDIPGTAATCTTDGNTDYVICSVCNAILKATEIIPGGHKYESETVDPDCVNAGSTKYTCTVCGDSYDEVIPALGHTYDIEADCNSGAICTVCGTETTEPIGHSYAPATCDTPATCVRCNATTGTPREHDMAPATCIKPSTCTLCGHTEGGLVNHSLTYKYVRSQLTYYCSVCNVSYTLSSKYFLDGGKYDNMQGVLNGANGFTVSSDNLPAVENGYYKLLNTTGTDKQYQLWVPHQGLVSTDFSLAKNSVGFISFKINAFTDVEAYPLSLRIVDGRETDMWDWNTMSSIIFQINPVISQDQTTTDIVGLGNRVIRTVTLQDDKFTGWLDVMIGIELNATSGQITLHYYINGENVVNYSMDMPIASGKISAIYLSGHTASKNSGVMFDDVGFGYTMNGEWLFDDCKHNFTTSVVDPNCTQDGYTLEECTLCGRKNYSNVVLATGHKGGTADCTNKAVCEVCSQPYGEPLGHTGGNPTCTEKPICEVCNQPYGTAEHKMSEATCYGPGKCTVCGLQGDPQTNHNPVAVIKNANIVYECKYCHKYYALNELEKGYYHDGTTSIGEIFTQDEGGAFNGGTGAVINDKGQYEFIHDDTSKSTKGAVWVPTNTNNKKGFNGFTSASGGVGVMSVSLNVNITHSAGLGLQFVDTELRNVARNFWSEGALPSAIYFAPPSNDVVVVKGWGNLELIRINLTADNRWTGWIDFDIGIVMNSNNTVTLYYYVNGKYVGTASNTMTIISGKIDGFYFNATATAPGTGFMFDDIAFGFNIPRSQNNADIFKGEGYTGDNTESDKLEVTELDKGNVTDAMLLAIDESKIKQFDGCDESVSAEDKATYGYFDKEGGKAKYVTVEKDGNTIEALYFSRTVAWTEAVTDTNAHWAEHRYTLDTSKTVKSISFDYLIKGTVTSSAQYGENILQIKKLDGEYEEVETGDDVYTEDGQWHTITYTFDTPIALSNFLIKLHHFLGEMLIANISVVYES